MKISRGKYNGIMACADSNGVIAAAAMDQRGSLMKSIAKARGEGAAVTSADLTAFKTAVTRVLSRHASAILLDPEYGLPALPHKASGAGVLLAYEKTGYDATVKGRHPDLLPLWSARRLVDAGADAVKLLLYYNPFDEQGINDAKHAFVERLGAECAGNDVALFLEVVCYDDALDEKGLEFARRKPAYVSRYMEEFSKPQYGVDVLKVEAPITLKFTAGTRAFAGTAAYTRAEAVEHFRATAAAARKPFIYLSAGVSDEVFRETLELAAEAGAPFAGVLCGRATWQDGIPLFASQGAGALEAWLEDRGVRNIEALNAVLRQGARPWWDAYGGRQNIEIA
jgi:tagatose 1,6-diphosphate aldolase